MRFIILGAGALGTIMAAYLARAGKDVALIARGNRAKLLAQNGITIRGLENFTTKIDIIDTPTTLSSADVLVIATKTYDTNSAINAICHMDIKNIFSIQNGVMKNSQLIDAFGEKIVLGAVGMLGGAIEPDGSTNYMMDNPVIVGELSGTLSPRVEAITSIFKNAKLPANASNNILSEEWSKFVGWLGLSALSVLTRLETWKFLSNQNTARIVARIMRETAQLPIHMGIPLKPGGPFDLDLLMTKEEDEFITLLQDRGLNQSKIAPNFRQSMLQDVDKGKQFEVEETFGYTVTEAKKYGLAVPTVETCYRVLSGLNSIQ